jgi:hypothetical protein
MTAQQRTPDDTAPIAAEEAFRGDDVDPQTHNAARCNLSVDACPECSRLENAW